jgi:hypothetical protein
MQLRLPLNRKNLIGRTWSPLMNWRVVMLSSLMLFARTSLFAQQFVSQQPVSTTDPDQQPRGLVPRPFVSTRAQDGWGEVTLLSLHKEVGGYGSTPNASWLSRRARTTTGTRPTRLTSPIRRGMIEAWRVQLTSGFPRGGTLGPELPGASCPQRTTQRGDGDPRSAEARTISTGTAPGRTACQISPCGWALTM